MTMVMRGGLLDESAVEEFCADGIGGLEVCEGDGECVRGVVRWCFGEAEECADHEGDLLFVGGAFADDGHFDFARGVFVDAEAVIGGGDE